jgi:hypothetical protein
MEAVKGLYDSEITAHHACGFCQYHHSYLTVKQMRCKNCLQKECRHLVKNENHQYWRQRELTKQKRKSRKEAINNLLKGYGNGN